MAKHRRPRGKVYRIIAWSDTAGRELNRYGPHRYWWARIELREYKDAWRRLGCHGWHYRLQADGVWITD